GRADAHDGVRRGREEGEGEGAADAGWRRYGRDVLRARRTDAQTHRRTEQTHRRTEQTHRRTERPGGQQSPGRSRCTGAFAGFEESAGSRDGPWLPLCVTSYAN